MHGIISIINCARVRDASTIYYTIGLHVLRYGVVNPVRMAAVTVPRAKLSRIALAMEEGCSAGSRVVPRIDGTDSVKYHEKTIYTMY